MDATNKTSRGLLNPAAPVVSPQEVQDSMSPASLSDAELGLPNFRVPQSTTRKPLVQPDGFALLDAAGRGLAAVTDGSLKNPEKYLRPHIG